MDKLKIINKVMDKLAKKKVKDKLPGGEGDGRPDSDFDAKQLAKGISIEMEHTDDMDLAKEISKDHLVENSNYYVLLEEMEKNF
jgi:hypothetical protein